MPKLDLYAVDSGPKLPIELGEVDIGLSNGDGEPVLLRLVNNDDLILTEIRVAVIGDGAAAVQLAQDHDGRPGGWSDDEIVARAGVLSPRHSCQFWSRAIVIDDLEVGQQDFEYLVKCTTTDLGE